jgi:hypothetical protein
MPIHGMSSTQMGARIRNDRFNLQETNTGLVNFKSDLI